MEGYIGAIMGWGPNWAPRNWTGCDGQLLAIAQYTAVFSLIGTIYGGDGRTTFAMPDLRGRTPIGSGHGPGLSNYPIGAKGGMEYVTLNQLEMPMHNHAISTQGMQGALMASTAAADQDAPAANRMLAAGRLGLDPVNMYTEGAANVAMPVVQVSGSATCGMSGGSQSHENRSPFQVITFVFCLQGIFPSRN